MQESLTEMKRMLKSRLQNRRLWTKRGDVTKCSCPWGSLSEYGDGRLDFVYNVYFVILLTRYSLT